jgi:hypothetical protein
MGHLGREYHPSPDVCRLIGCLCSGRSAGCSEADGRDGYCFAAFSQCSGTLPRYLDRLDQGLCGVSCLSLCPFVQSSRRGRRLPQCGALTIWLQRPCFSHGDMTAPIFCSVAPTVSWMKSCSSPALSDETLTPFSQGLGF